MFCVAFGGGSGSGKSSVLHFMAGMRPEVHIAILPMDAYYKDHSHLSLQEKRVCNFDHPQAMDYDLFFAHIENLRSGVPVRKPVYSFITCSRLNETEIVYPAEMLFIEGLFTLYDQRVRNIMDFRVFIDCSLDIRRERVCERDMKERNRTREETDSRFASMVEPMHNMYIEPTRKYANLIVDSSSHSILTLASTIWEAIDIKINNPSRLMHFPVNRR